MGLGPTRAVKGRVPGTALGPPKQLVVLTVKLFVLPSDLPLQPFRNFGSQSRKFYLKSLPLPASPLPPLPRPGHCNIENSEVLLMVSDPYEMLLAV